MKVSIFPNLLAVDKKNISSVVDELINFRVNHVHFDVMDKKFVGHSALKINDFKKIKDKKIKYDIHLMVDNPREYAKKFIDLGAKTIIFHYESFVSKIPIAKFISNLHLLNVKVGIAFKFETSIKSIKESFFFIRMADFVLIMAKNNKQKFDKKILKKIKICFDYIKQNNLKTLIEVEGGINEKTCLECCKNGAKILVVGSYLFKNEDEIKERYKKIISECNKIIIL